MRASTAFFAGIGTVGLAIAGGLGGGLWIGKVMNPHVQHGLEAATPGPQALPASSPLSYVGASLAFIDPAVDGRRKKPQQRADSSNAAPAPPRPVEAKAPSNQTAKAADAAPYKSAAQDAKPVATVAAKPASPSEDAYAKARDSDLKHQTERRRTERAQHWASRHRYEPQNQPKQESQDNSDQQANSVGDDKSSNDSIQKPSERRYSGYSSHRYRTDSRSRYRDAERWYRDDSDSRVYRDEPSGYDVPQVRLFDPDD